MSSRRGRGRVLLRWLPALAIMAIIFLLSSQSGLRVSDDVQVDRPFRVLGHLGAYAALAAALLYAIAAGSRPGLRDVVIAFTITVAYGVSDEIHQAFVPDRTGRIDDVLVDAIGASLGLVVATILLRRPLSQADSRR